MSYFWEIFFKEKIEIQRSVTKHVFGCHEYAVIKYINKNFLTETNNTSKGSWLKCCLHINITFFNQLVKFIIMFNKLIDQNYDLFMNHSITGILIQSR